MNNVSVRLKEIQTALIKVRFLAGCDRNEYEKVYLELWETLELMAFYSCNPKVNIQSNCIDVVCKSVHEIRASLQVDFVKEGSTFERFSDVLTVAIEGIELFLLHQSPAVNNLDPLVSLNSSILEFQ